jgi:hypothetical protein
VEVKPQMDRTEFAVKMSNILANQVFSQHDLTTVLNKEGFACTSKTKLEAGVY